MLEDRLDIWTEPCDAICITTNGFVKVNGALVMGAGVAGQAQARYPAFPKIAGAAVKRHGNIVMAFHSDHLERNHFYDPPSNQWFITFPVKHKWFESADLELIEQSANQLMTMLSEPAFSSWKKVLLPRPGCGNGHLSWDQVKPVIQPILSDRVVVVTN